MIQLKSLKLKTKIIQSPMAGCTDLAFRMVAREHGMEFAFLEMVSSEALVRENQKTAGLLKSVPLDRPLGAQLVGCRPEIMGQAAVMIEEMGFDLLDINMGCPVPKITGPGGGSALLAEPDTAQKIFQQVVRNVKKIPVTVKMRKGFSDPSGEEAVRIARMAEDAGLSAVTVHGRTRTQGYQGTADWEAIGRVKAAVRIPVFGNGDVIDGASAKKLMDVSGCDGVMIGRGALGNPWLYKSIDAHIRGESEKKVPTVHDKKKALLRHIELEIETEGERLAALKCRKIVCWYFKDFPGASEFRNRINRSQSVAEIINIIEDCFPGG